jgi:3-dehydroquinate dehydratase
MPTIQDPGPRTEDGPISFADVLACVPTDELGALQADATNAGAIRVQLGRGSTTTVQRHLDAIRAELAAADVPLAAGAIPQAPGDAVAAIWAAAWSAAQRDTLARLDRITAERDAARYRVSVLIVDRDAAVLDADEQRELAVRASAVCNDATMMLAARETAFEDQVGAANASRVEAEVTLVREREQFQQESKLAAANYEIERRTMQSQIDKLQERLAEFRALEIWAAGQAAPKAPDWSCLSKHQERPTFFTDILDRLTVRVFEIKSDLFLLVHHMMNCRLRLLINSHLMRRMSCGNTWILNRYLCLRPDS